MNNKRFEIFRWFGIPIRIDLSWLLILFLVTYSLAVGFFPEHHPGYPSLIYWLLGLITAVGLFFSILFHEMSHALVARHYKIKMDGITLFIFGGVAEMREEPHSPKAEFFMAVAGPVASLFLSALFFLMNRGIPTLNESSLSGLIFRYLGMMNLILAIFNMVPAFPLDGGRIFRSILWGIKKDFVWATKIAARVGRGFGWLLIIYGGFQMFTGLLFGGFWYILIGFFLKRASQMSEEQLVLKTTLEKIPVTSLMHTRFTQFKKGDSLINLVGILTNKNLLSVYPVVENEHLIGYLSIAKLQQLTRDQWGKHQVEDIFESDFSSKSIDFKANAWEAFQKMAEEKLNNLFVTDGDDVRGIVAIEDMAHYVGKIT